jgi:hypothetical protein
VTFKEIDWTSLPPSEQFRIFHSSGTTAQRPSRHFHSAESLRLYEGSALTWFQPHLMPAPMSRLDCWFLAPPPDEAPHSSLVHMFDVVRRASATANSTFLARSTDTGGWVLDLEAIDRHCADALQHHRPVALLGTAFAFVHLVDALTATRRRLVLPPGSRVMETGGYKGRSRALPRRSLHELITRRLGVPPTHIVSEYGMSELSSQAYDHVAGDPEPAGRRAFRFPPWARVTLVSPENGQPVDDGQPGLIRVCDLANVRSVAFIQTEDVGVRRGSAFAWLGRAADAEPRGCSLQDQPPECARLARKSHEGADAPISGLWQNRALMEKGPRTLTQP